MGADIILVESQTEPGSGWWTGWLQTEEGGRSGIFPANHVDVLESDDQHEYYNEEEKELDENGMAAAENAAVDGIEE